MRFFVEVNGNFTRTFVSDHRRLVVAKTNFKFISCGTDILHIALLTCNQVNNIFGPTTENLLNRIRPASSSASKAIGVFEIIATQITLGCALKTAPLIVRGTMLITRLAA